MLIGAVGLNWAILMLSLPFTGSLAFVFVWSSTLLLLALVGRALLFARMDRSPASLALALGEHTLGDPWKDPRGLLGTGYRVTAVVDPDAPRFPERLNSAMTVHAVDQVVLSTALDRAELNAAVEICRQHGAETLTLAELYEDLTGQCLLDSPRGLTPLPRTIWHVAGSRLVDVLVGLGYIPVAAIAVSVSALASGPTLVRQSFTGKGGRAAEFSMIPMADRRSTRLRRLLAWTPFRFAPAFPALLAGRLAVVGPSPVSAAVDGGMDAPLRELRRSVRPGLTGWAAINGFPAGHDSLPYDLYYVRHRSLGFDLAILLPSLASPVLSWRALHRALAPHDPEGEEIVAGARQIPVLDEMVSVIVPAYREGGRIEDALRLLVGEMETLDVPFEVIVVSDGSDDDTHVEARRVQGPITVIHYPENRGKGYAIRRGLSESRGSRVVFIDADMDLHPDGIGRLLSLLDAGADAAVGSKRHPESQVYYPRLRRIQSASYQWLVRRLFGLSLSDTQSGLKAFRGPLLRDAASALTTDGFAFDLELLVELYARGAVVVEGPVHLDYAFRSTTGARAVWDVLRETLRLWHRRRAVGAGVTEIIQT